MRFMTKKQEEVLRQLVSIADGNPLLVEQALRASAPDKEVPSLTDVVAYIKKHLPAPRKKRA